MMSAGIRIDWLADRVAETAELEIISEASDGLEAVQKNNELRPDLPEYRTAHSQWNRSRATNSAFTPSSEYCS